MLIPGYVRREKNSLKRKSKKFRLKKKKEKKEIHLRIYLTGHHT